MAKIEDGSAREGPKQVAKSAAHKDSTAHDHGGVEPKYGFFEIDFDIAQVVEGDAGTNHAGEDTGCDIDDAVLFLQGKVVSPG